MSVTTVEGIVKNGKVIIPDDMRLPEDARVYVVIPNLQRPKRVMSPRLVNKADAALLVKTVEDDFDD